MNQRIQDEIVARAKSDPAFQERLLANPGKVVKESLPAGELSEEQLDQVAGGIIAILIGRSGGNQTSTTR
ncbi:MAG: hypothetical protein AB7K24_22645 [Gemmataceae bacterium]